jgi:anti-sigma B factor antagonist
MNITTKSLGGVTVVTVDGSIDSKTAPELQQKILEATAGTNMMVIDLSAVSFVSSAGLRVLLMVYRQVKSKDGKVILAGVSEEIKDVMSMTGFITFFELAETEAEAITKF